MNQTNTGRMAAACSLLAESERRFVLYSLASEEPAQLSTLVRQIAAWQTGSVDEETTQRIYIGLVHNHLPRLEDHGIIEYDLRSGDVVLDEGFEDVRSLLEQFRQTEDVPEIRERPALC